MKRREVKINALFTIVFLLLHTSIAITDSGTLSRKMSASNKEKLLNGDVIIALADLEDKIVGVTGTIFIGCQPQDVWSVLTDYDNLHRFIPKMLRSEVLEEKGNEKIIKQIGRTGISIFQKTARIKMKVHEEYLQRINFEKVSGDFKVFRGEWLLEYDPETTGTLLTYQAEIKPKFFAPQAFIRHVQKNDLPLILQAIKKRAKQLKESKELSSY